MMEEGDVVEVVNVENVVNVDIVDSGKLRICEFAEFVGFVEKMSRCKTHLSDPSLTSLSYHSKLLHDSKLYQKS